MRRDKPSLAYLADRDNVHETVAMIIAQWERERPDLDFEPMSLLASLTRAHVLTAVMLDKYMAGYNITRGMFDVLAGLRRAGPPYRLTPSQLSASLLLSGAGTTNRLDRLEEMRLIARKPDPDDRRSISIQLTNRGSKLVDAILPGLLDCQRAVFSIGREKGRNLTKLLMNLNEELTLRIHD
jgi:DNA-binding MarR family transcriptional regulator